MIQLASVPTVGPVGPAPAALKIANGVSDFALALSSLALPGKLVAPTLAGEGEPADPLLPERQSLAADGKELPDAPGLFDTGEEEEAAQDEGDAPEAPAPVIWFAPVAPEAQSVPEAQTAEAGTGNSAPRTQPQPAAEATPAPIEPTVPLAQPTAAPTAQAAVVPPSVEPDQIARAEAGMPMTEPVAPRREQPSSDAPPVHRARKHGPATDPGKPAAAPAPAAQEIIPNTPNPAAAVQPASPAAEAAASIAVPALKTDAIAKAPRSAPDPRTTTVPPRSSPALVPAPAASAPAIVGQAAVGMPRVAPAPVSDAAPPVSESAAAPAVSAVPAAAATPVAPTAPATPAAGASGGSEPVSPVDPRQLAAAPVIRIEAPRHWAQRAEPFSAPPLAPAFTRATPAAPVAAAVAAAALAESDIQRLTTARDPAAPEAVQLAQSATVAAPAVTASSDTQQAPLDMRRHEWPGQMIERIEALRDAAPLRETKISLMPEALGRVDISIRQDGDRVHVHFATETQAARQMIADAQPRLGEIAESRGLKLGQTSVETGGTGAQLGSGQRHDAQAHRNSQPSAQPNARAGTTATTDIDDERIA